MHCSTQRGQFPWGRGSEGRLKLLHRLFPQAFGLGELLLEVGMFVVERRIGTAFGGGHPLFEDADGSLQLRHLLLSLGNDSLAYRLLSHRQFETL